MRFDFTEIFAMHVLDFVCTSLVDFVVRVGQSIRNVVGKFHRKALPFVLSDWKSENWKTVFTKPSDMGRYITKTQRRAVIFLSNSFLKNELV